MALYVTRPRGDEVRIGRGLPSGYTCSDIHGAPVFAVSSEGTPPPNLISLYKYGVQYFIDMTYTK